MVGKGRNSLVKHFDNRMQGSVYVQVVCTLEGTSV